MLSASASAPTKAKLVTSSPCGQYVQDPRREESAPVCVRVHYVESTEIHELSDELISSTVRNFEPGLDVADGERRMRDGEIDESARLLVYKHGHGHNVSLLALV